MKKTAKLQVDSLTFVYAFDESDDDSGDDTDDKVGRFERAVALLLVENGARTPGALRVIREAAMLSQRELAELLDVDKARVSDWERGKHRFDLATWNTVADLLVERTSTETRLRRAVEPQPREQVRMTAADVDKIIRTRTRR